MSAGVRVLEKSVWWDRQAAHIARAEEFSRGHLRRRAAGEPHPVEDFMWNYYRLNPGVLRRWHPGAGVVLEGGVEDLVNDPPRPEWKYYVAQAGDLRVDTGAFLADRERTVTYVRALVGATLSRPARFGCFGMHEWAMVYRTTPRDIRHAGLPLRLPHAQVDEVVEAANLVCTHVDAFRFFTPAAAPLNAAQLTRADQLRLEQPGCLHAGMDLYKWIGKLGPLLEGELLLDAFELARSIREVDMRASPYDVSELHGASGERLEPIEVDTAAGKRQYVALQREFSTQAHALRERLLVGLALIDDVRE